MGKSSIHILPVKGGSEQHNQREKELNYVRSDLSHLNSSYIGKSIAEARKFAEENCKEKTGRTMQKAATPIREGVLLISEKHTAQDLKKLGDKIEERFGIKTIQAYAHKDEGHYNKTTGDWKPNHHGHMVFDWMNHETGKSIKLNRDDMAELQSIVANELGLERGVSSSKTHLNAIQYKNQEEQKELENRYGKEEALKSLNEIKEQTKLQEYNLDYVKKLNINEEEVFIKLKNEVDNLKRQKIQQIKR